MAGVAAGHWLLYSAVAPSGSQREDLLQATGHTYWRIALLTGLLLGFASLAVLVLRHFRAGLYGAAADLPGYLRLALRLSAIQAVGFTALENFERTLAGGSLGSLLEDDLLTLGLLIQVVVAFVIARLLRWLAHAAEVIGSALQRVPCPQSPAIVAFPSPSLLGTGRICDTGRGRGPPAALLLSR